MPWHLCKMKCALIKFNIIHYEMKYWCWPPPPHPLTAPHPPPSTRAGTHTPRDLISRSNKSFKLACFSKLTLTRMREMSGYWPRVRGHVIPSSPSITDRMFLQGMSLSRSCLCPFARYVWRLWMAFLSRPSSDENQEYMRCGHEFLSRVQGHNVTVHQGLSYSWSNASASGPRSYWHLRQRRGTCQHRGGFSSVSFHESQWHGHRRVFKVMRGPWPC